MYTGLLTLEQVADGRLKALRNAEELLADARCLYRKRRWARSYFLSQIAVEEAGKYFYLFSACVMVVSGRIRWPRFWKSVRSHSDKTTLFLMMEEMFIPSAAGPKQIDDLQSDARFLERGKMWSLYADYEQNEFFAPSELIERALTKQARVWPTIGYVWHVDSNNPKTGPARFDALRPKTLRPWKQCFAKR